ncbi:uroporphyrinogen-III C-methyltransferase [Geobacter sp. AOG1]|uniref:uroporphyrinogen-III C-methyltransferase n=1 Tax=Geobacter sp. AOG1 TaxID=1566346 RepID=UPI001CC79E2D|nr:uroporphyrinogen-III C-methyltransferase [Geobacter sp. AOG1]GFE57432.1 uroporphyrinogen III methyltransferase [Geobacter sp. AOG1]
MQKYPQTNGFVYLIGAGPGDPGLITVRGRECIGRAEVILYDYLANEELLRHARQDAELIYAGKVGGAHNREQSQINDLLVQKALEGKIVARLKGGDPFVFGRGGEECEALVAHQIPFEIVPGVTAGIGAAAYAGIPLTHRDFTTSVAFVTGHEGHDKDVSTIDWERLSVGSGTIVFYMGIKNLPQITASLMAHGRPPETPVALIRWGTRPDQEVLTGTLADIAETARKTGFKAPAITVVGEVVTLRKKLRWFDNRPLFGRTILVTRAADQAGEFSRFLEAQGARVLECPTIRIAPPESFAGLDDAIARLADFHWLIFSSANAVGAFFSRLHALELDSRAIGPCKVCAVGPKTAELLQHHGIRADLIPDDYKGEGVVAAFAARNIRGQQILFPKGDRAREVIPAGLAQRGAEVTAPVAYRNLAPDAVPPSVLTALEERRVDCVTFTASSTASNLADLLGENRFLNLLEGVTVASIGPITSRTCRDLGLEVHIEPREYTLAALTADIVNYYRSRM